MGRAKGIIFTPEMARRYIGPVTSDSEVKRYAHIMRTGHWDASIAPLRIWKNGVMLNGFTRMAAVQTAGVPVPFDVDIIQAVEWRIENGKLRSTLHHLETMTEKEVITTMALGASSQLMLFQ